MLVDNGLCLGDLDSGQQHRQRKDEKEEFLRAGKAIDGIANILKYAVTEREKQLEQIEKHQEIKERQRLDAIKNERTAALIDVSGDDAPIPVGLELWEPDVWQNYLNGVIKTRDDRIAAEKKAEADRIAAEKAKAEEDERIRLENIKLREEKEAAEREAEKQRQQQALIEKKRAEEEAARKKKEAEEQAAYEAELAKERAKREAELQAERKAAREREEAAAAELERERAERQRIADEQAAKEAAEREAAEQAAEAERQRMAEIERAGDSAKLAEFKKKLIDCYNTVPALSNGDLHKEIKAAIKKAGELCK